MIGVLLVEDHNVVRNGIKSLLEKEATLEVIAEATNGSRRAPAKPDRQNQCQKHGCTHLLCGS